MNCVGEHVHGLDFSDLIVIFCEESDITSLRVFMVSLRKKIEQDPAKPIYIQTRVGIGYRMNQIGEE